MRGITTIIFDLDGLMVDSEPSYRTAAYHAILEQGFILTDELCDRVTGVPHLACEQIMQQEFGSGFSIEKYRKAWVPIWYRLIESSGMRLKPGLIELLEWAGGKKLKYAVATSSNYDDALFSLKSAGIDGRITTIISGDRIKNGKPAPDIFLAAATATGTPPAECLVLEDSNAGVEAAHRAGMRVIMVPDLVAASAQSQRLACMVVPTLHDALKQIRTAA